MAEEGKCPKCEAFAIDYGEGYYSKGHYCYDAKCLKCGTKFVEKYDLVFEDAVIIE